MKKFDPVIAKLETDLGTAQDDELRTFQRMQRAFNKLVKIRKRCLRLHKRITARREELQAPKKLGEVS